MKGCEKQQQQPPLLPPCHSSCRNKEEEEEIKTKVLQSLVRKIWQDKAVLNSWAALAQQRALHETEGLSEDTAPERCSVEVKD